MTDPTSANILLALPLRGSDVGTWDIPVNNNSTAIDGFLGGVQTVPLSSTSVVVLTAPAGIVTPGAGPTQAQNAILKFTGALTVVVTVILPLPGHYIVDTFGLSGFNSALLLQAPGASEVISLPFGEVHHIYTDGAVVRFMDLPMIGSFVDFPSNSVPPWITACTKPPYLLCNGTPFSGTTYPVLANILGGTNTPDFRGRAAYYLNQGTGRLQAAGAGIDGNTLLAAGGVDGITLLTSNLPPYTPTGSVSTTLTPNTGLIGAAGGQVNIGGTGSGGSIAPLVPSSSFLGSPQGGTSQTIINAAPGVVSGIRMIRAG